MLDIRGRTVERIGLVDDEPSSRQSMDWLVVDLELESVQIDGPLPPIDQFLASSRQLDAMICDHHLAMHSYATFDGAELVARAFDAGRLALLCTRFTTSDLVSIRPHLPSIPVLVRPDELNEADELIDALTECAAELAGDVPPERRSWRTQVVIDRIDEDDQMVDISIPAWEVEEAVRYRSADLPPLGDDLHVGFRCHAQVNLGTEDPSRLFIHKWEWRR